MGKASLVIGLVDDARQQRFYRYLKESGYQGHEIRFRAEAGPAHSGFLIDTQRRSRRTVRDPLVPRRLLWLQSMQTTVV
jgi:hypothetical protein